MIETDQTTRRSETGRPDAPSAARCPDARQIWTRGCFRELAASEGDRRRRVEESIVLAHLDVVDRLVHRLAPRYRDDADLRQVGCVGLINAVRRYDAARGEDFLAFAVPTISGEIKRYLRDQGWFAVVLAGLAVQDEPAFGVIVADHNAANLARLAADLGLAPGESRAYRVAWIGGCVMERAAPEPRGRGRGRAVARDGALRQRRPAAERRAPPGSRDDGPGPGRRRDRGRARRGGRPMRGEPMAQPEFIRVQQALGGMDYPASKDEILRRARESGADQDVLDALDGIPDREYDRPTAVSEAVAS